MKTLAYYLLGIFSLCILNACDNEENPTPEPPPSKGQEEVQKIVEVLKESNPEVSQFVEILEKVNVANLTQDELTVFAVKNTSTASRAAVLDTASIKNHIAKGSYTKDDLKDGTKLTSISNETLYVTRTENDVQINGVKIEGNAIPAGNSYVYVVPEVIPMIEAPATYKHQTTIIVKELIAKNYPSLPLLAEVTIEAKDGSNQPVGTFKTNAEGSVVISHNCDTLIYRLQKTDYADLNDGWIYAGTLDENGNYMYKDLNGDAKLDINDKVNNIEWPYQVIYEKDAQEVNSIHEHFMVPVDKIEEINKIWYETMSNYYENKEILNRQLLTGEGGFNYNNDIAAVSGNYWYMAVNTINILKELQTSLLEIIGEESQVLDPNLINLIMSTQEVNINFYEFYGQTPSYTNEELIDQLRSYAEYLPEKESMQIRSWLAEVYLLEEKFQQAIDIAKDLNDRGMSTSESLLICAIASNKISNSNIEDALRYLNEARARLNGLEPVTSLEGEVLIKTCHFEWGVQNPYPYYRILEENINCNEIVAGFSADKNHLLPIPRTELTTYPHLKQNPGYE